MDLEKRGGDWNLDTFADSYFGGCRGSNCNKIKKINKKSVINFMPKLSNNPKSPMYVGYCKLSLVCYKPWSGDFPYQDASEEEIVKKWKDFVSEMEHPPEHLIQKYCCLTDAAASLNRENIGENFGIVNRALDGAGDVLGYDIETRVAPWNIDIGITEWAEEDDQNEYEMDWQEDHNWLESENHFTGFNKTIHDDVVEELEDKISLEQIRERIVPEVEVDNLNECQLQFYNILT